LLGAQALHLIGVPGMFLPLTDLLTCPRCGPEYGLILLADRIEDRRVLAGALGCPRCHTRYPITAGLADLRLREAEEPAEQTESEGTSASAGESAAEGSDREEAVRLAALLGLAEG